MSVVHDSGENTHIAVSLFSAQPPSYLRLASQTPGLPHPDGDALPKSVPRVNIHGLEGKKTSTHRFEFVQLGVWLIRRLVGPRLGQHLVKVRKHLLLVQLVPVKWQALDELLDGALRLEREQREAKRDVAPLAGIFRQPETLAQFLDNVFRLFFLPGGVSPREEAG